MVVKKILTRVKTMKILYNVPIWTNVEIKLIKKLKCQGKSFMLIARCACTVRNVRAFLFHSGDCA